MVETIDGWTEEAGFIGNKMCIVFGTATEYISHHLWTSILLGLYIGLAKSKGRVSGLSRTVKEIFGYFFAKFWLNILIRQGFGVLG